MFDKIAALIIRDKKLLLVREKGKDVFLLPGGKRRLGESDEAALRRELREELGVAVKEMKFYGKYTEAYGIITIIAYICAVDGAMKPCGEIVEMKWDDSATEVKMHDTTRERIFPELAGEGLIG